MCFSARVFGFRLERLQRFGRQRGGGRSRFHDRDAHRRTRHRLVQIKRRFFGDFRGRAVVVGANSSGRIRLRRVSNAVDRRSTQDDRGDALNRR